jgi:hypothetical protein
MNGKRQQKNFTKGVSPNFSVAFPEGARSACRSPGATWGNKLSRRRERLREMVSIMPAT